MSIRILLLFSSDLHLLLKNTIIKIEHKHTRHSKNTFWWFLVYSQVCVTITIVNFKTFLLPQRKSFILQLALSFLPSSTQTWASTNLLSVSKFLYYGLPSGWNYMRFLWPASFPSHAICMVHSSCNRYQYSLLVMAQNIPLHRCITFCLSICLLVDISIIHLMAIINNATLNIRV